jgi:glycosyltransferase involved in cell wall biosynthesis
LKKPKKILFITHVASLGGAPILLLRLMRLLKENGYGYNTLVMENGPLVKEFGEVSDKCEVYRRHSKKSVSEKIKARVLGKENSLQDLLHGVDLIFSNTIVNGRILNEIKKVSSAPVISYIHELELVTALTTTKETLHYAITNTSFFFVPCKVVEVFLIDSLKINKEKLAMLNYYLPDENLSIPIKEKINSPFIVGCLATVEWRKGADLFLQVVANFFSIHKNSDVKFFWMGNYSEAERLRFSYDAEKLGIKENIELLPPSENVETFWNSINVLLLPSREDPYPVVVLEAAMHKIPTVCFKNSGGASEFIGDDAGTTVDYLDIEKVIRAILSYYRDPSLLKTHGIKAFNKVKQLHGDKSLIKQQFNNGVAKIGL